MIRTTRRLGAALCAAALAGRAWALDLSAYLQAVKDRNPSLQQAQAEAEARAAAARQEAAWSNPTVSVEGGGRNDDVNSGNVLGASFSQGFVWPGKRGARLELARLEEQAAPLALRAAEAALAEEALMAALQQAAAQQHWNSAQDRQLRLEPVQAFLRSQAFASPQQRTDRDVVETRLMNLSAERARHQQELEGAQAEVRALSGSTLEWALPGVGSLGPAPDEDAVLKGNPELALARLQLEQAGAQARLAAKAALPDPELSVAYEREALGGVDQTLRGGLRLPLPVLNANGAGKRAAASAQRAAGARVAVLERSLKRRSLALHQRLKSLDAAAAAYPAGTLEGLERSLKEAERQFKVGRLALVSYLELEAEAAETREGLLSLGQEKAQALLELRALAGWVDAPAALAGAAMEGSHAE